MTDPSPAAFVESMIDANGVGVRCRAAGAGEALVVLRDPEELAPSGALGLLAARRRVVTLEIPRGDAGTAAAAIAALGCGRNALWGHGAAAGLALSAAMAQPEAVDSIVLVAPTALDDIGGRDDTFAPRLKDLAVPALALFGTEDRIAPCETAHRYRTAMPNCSVVMVYDAGHAIDTDRPEAVAAVVEDFLARHEGFLVRRTSGLIHP